MGERWPSPRTLAAWLFAIAAGLLAGALVTGCASWLRTTVPDDARAPTDAEHAAIVDVLERWASHPELVPPSSDCARRVLELRVWIVDADDLGSACQQVVAKSGNACMAIRGGVYLVVIHEA